MNRLSELELGNVLLTDGTTDLQRLPTQEQSLLRQHDGQATLVRITGPVSYAVARGLKSRFAQLQHRDYLIIDISDAAIIGISTAMVLEELVRSAQLHGSGVRLVDSQRSHRHELRQLDVMQLIGEKHCVDTVTEAFQSIEMPDRNAPPATT